MKKLLALLLALVCAASVAMAFFFVDGADRQRLEESGATVGTVFVIPEDQRFADPDLVQAALASAATSAHANVIRTAPGYTAGGQAYTTYFVQLTNDTRLREHLPVRDGRWLTPADMTSPDAFLSTQISEENGHLGTLRDFGGTDHVSVRPMRQAATMVTPPGRYQVETTNPSTFLNQLAHELGERTGAPGSLTAEDLTRRNSVGGGGGSGDALFYATALALIAMTGLTGLLLLYHVLRETKTCGVMALLGQPARRTWFVLTGRMIALSLALSLLALWVASTFVVRDVDPTFPVGASAALIAAHSALALVAMLAVLHTRRMPLNEAIKNRQDTFSLFFANSVLKAICSVAVIVLATGIVMARQQIAAEERQIEGWTAAAGYGVFVPTKVGNDLGAIQSGQPGPETAQVHELYEELNRRGALFVNATAFRTGSGNGSATPSALRVNPNYLARYPIRGADGQPVTVPEDEQSWVVLIPENLRHDEARLRAHFQASRTGPGSRFAQEKRFYGRDVPAHLTHQQVRIIWIPTGQRVFSFNPEVNPHDAGLLTDPIVEVLTQANSVGADRFNAITGGPDAAVKVKLLPEGSAATLASLDKLLHDLQLDDNLRHLVTMEEYVADRVRRVQNERRMLAVTSILLLTGTLIMLVQSTTILFTRQARPIVVRALFGQSMRTRYREVWQWLAVTWVLQFVVGVLILTLSGSPMSRGPDPARPHLLLSLTIATAVTAIEAAFASMALLRTERRHTVAILKGEF